MGLNSGKTLLGHSLCLCSIFVLYILQAEHILGWRFCGWVAIPMLPLGVFPGYGKELLHNPYSSLLGVSATFLYRLLGVSSHSSWWIYPTNCPWHPRFPFTLSFLFSLSLINPTLPWYPPHPFSHLVSFHYTLHASILFPFGERHSYLGSYYFGSGFLWL